MRPVGVHDPGVRKALGGLAAAAILGATGLAAAAGSNALHGALDMKAQQARLEKLGPKGDPAAAPAGVDDAVWRTLVSKDNATTPERVALGHKLYFDVRLSKDGTVSCATCHDVSRGFTDQRAVSEGIGDKLGPRNAPTTANSVFFETFFLDGRAPSLEEQAKLPILNPIEMGQPTPEATMKGIEGDAEYVTMFQAAYGRKPNYEDLGRAIAAFERTLVFLDSPFDRFVAGDASAISEDAKKGFALYSGKARCQTCHQLNRANPIGTDNRFHNVGVSARHQDFEDLAKKALAALGTANDTKAVDELALSGGFSETGRFLVTKNRADLGAFKTSQVRNVGLTGPYMHDGSLTTLWDVMDHYNKGGEANPYLDGGIEPLALSEPEIDQVVAFLFALTDARFADQNQAEMARQRKIAAKQRPFRDDDLAHRRTFAYETPAKGGGKKVLE